MVIDRRRFFTYRYQKIGFEQPVADVIFGLRRHLAADFAFPPLRVNCISYIISQLTAIDSPYVMNICRKP
jgi:hypothetical protein